MAFVQLEDGEMHYQIDGPADAPVLVLSNSLGTDLRIWDRVVSALGDQFRVLRYDKRGHGLSSCPPPPYSVEDLTRDTEELLAAIRAGGAPLARAAE